MNKSKLCLFSFVVLFSLVGCGESNSSSSSSISSSSSFPTSSSVVSSSSSSSDSTISKYAPVISDDKKTVTYGYYPQTHVSDNATITALDALTSAESNGWYKYNDEYYYKLSASPFNTIYTFDDGVTIESGTQYWFKCEPITWKVLKTENDNYTLVSNMLLDAHMYDSSSNKYSTSSIRTWLNDTFYNSAFNFDSSYIQVTEVDNSASTTDSTSNPYACENTNDKVYLLSYQDYKNTNYFADNASKYCKTTDYARANGAYSSVKTDYLNNGSYWTRSAASYDPDDAFSVSNDGSLGHRTGCISYTYIGVCPSIQIKVTK